jgi:phosphatidylserine decarboxylase
MSFLDDAQIALQHVLPGHLLSRAVGRLAFCEIPQIKNALISQFIKRFEIDMEAVAEPSLDAYPHFNAFFTRALKDGIRPLAGKHASRPRAIISVWPNSSAAPSTMRPMQTVTI